MHTCEIRHRLRSGGDQDGLGATVRAEMKPGLDHVDRVRVAMLVDVLNFQPAADDCDLGTSARLTS